MSRFRQSAQRVQQAQCQILKEILQTHQDCEVGRRFDFQRLARAADLPHEFRQRVPLVEYEDVQPLLARIVAGESGVLTTQRVLILEPTGGSSGGTKLIPYTRLLRRQFYRGIAAWIADLYGNRPHLMQGRAYWSISPNLEVAHYSSGGIPIGFEEDAGYLTGVGQWLAPHLLVGDRSLAQLTAMDEFREATLRYLLAADDLTLISIWSPTFLTALLADLEQDFDRYLHALDTGTSQMPRPNRSRARQLHELRMSDASWPEILQPLWPRLGLISCWGDGAARNHLPALRRLFPQVEIQPKGLLATECFVSFPLVGQAGSALSLRSHFFEFEPTDPTGTVAGGDTRLANELTLDATYRVVVTTGGGLYRYRLGDLVRVVGFVAECPLLSFVGRGQATCDLVGEKLSEAQVTRAIRVALDNPHAEAVFAMLAPVDATVPYYCLYIQTDGLLPTDSRLADWAQTLEQGLGENPHYQYAVALGQLRPVQIRVLPTDSVNAARRYVDVCQQQGQKLGDIKPVMLHPWSGWSDVFD